MLGAVAMAFVGRDRNIVRHAGLAILFMLLCSPMIQPWYLLWAIPMLAATGLRSHFQLMWYFITTLFFMAYGVSDQLNVSPYLRDFNQDMGRLIATVICLGYIIYLVALDPATRRLVYVSLHPTQIRRTTIRLWWRVPRRIKPPCTPPRCEEGREGSRQGRLLARTPGVSSRRARWMPRQPDEPNGTAPA